MMKVRAALLCLLVLSLEGSVAKRHRQKRFSGCDNLLSCYAVLAFAVQQRWNIDVKNIKHRVYGTLNDEEIAHMKFLVQKEETMKRKHQRNMELYRLENGMLQERLRRLQEQIKGIENSGEFATR